MGRKHRKKELTRAERLKQSILQIDEQIEQAFEQAKEYSKNKEEGKATQAQTRWAILVDKRKIMQKELDDLLAVKPEGDRTVEWSNKTAELFYQWLRQNDDGYYRFLQLTKANPDVLKTLLQINLDKPMPKFELKEKSK